VIELLYKIISNKISENSKVLIFNYTPFPIYVKEVFGAFVSEDIKKFIDNIIVISYNNFACLEHFVNSIPEILSHCPEINLVIIDKINYIFEKNFDIKIEESYFDCGNRVMPSIEIQKLKNKKYSINNNAKAKARKTRNSSRGKNRDSIIGSPEGIMNVIKRLFNFQVEFNFNLILTQYDFNRIKAFNLEKFNKEYSNLTMKEDGEEKYLYVNCLSNCFQLQFIPSEREKTINNISYMILSGIGENEKQYYKSQLI
jgi:hypothetical protein